MLNKYIKKIQTTKQNIKTTHKQSKVENKYLEKQLLQFKHMFKRMKKITSNEQTVAAMEQDTRLKYRSNNLEYLVWSVIAGVTLFLTVRHITK